MYQDDEPNFLCVRVCVRICTCVREREQLEGGEDAEVTTKHGH